MSEQLDRIEKEVAAIKHLLTGNGTPEHGMIVRVDRLEQSDRNRSWWTRTAAAAGVTALVATCWNVVRGGQ